MRTQVHNTRNPEMQWVRCVRHICARVGMVLAAVAIASVAYATAPTVADARPEVDDAARELAERYAPIVMLVPQGYECDPSGEAFEPTSVEIVLDNPAVLLRQVGRGDPVVKAGPSAADLYDLGDGFYLDFPGLALDPGCIYEQDFRRFARDVPPTVYAHVVQQADRPGLLAVQYWFFWYYNEWNNVHEGDWEFVQLLFEADSAAEALGVAPVSIGLAQHEGGERGDWDDPKVERVGDRPVVYPSVGSHATYFETALFLGRSGSEGFGCDDTTGATRRVDPEVVVLPHEPTGPDDEFAWLSFTGRWGERGPGPYNGPTGPIDKDQWTAPVDWHDELRTSSVVVPAGETPAAGLARSFCAVVGWGSVQVIQLQLSPLRVTVVVVVAFLLARWLARRTTWDRVDVEPLVARRRAGQILRGAPRLLVHRPVAMLLIGAAYIPAAALAGLLVVVAQALPGLGPLFDLAGRRNSSGVALALFTGGLASLIAGVFVLGAVAHLMTSRAPGSDAAAARRAIRAVLTRWRDLAAALARAVVIVALLMISLVGIPWAIRQIVRYQFLASAIVIGGEDGGSALRRSTQLVRGRWWHTAVVVAVVHTALAVASVIAGLLLLVAARSLPLWTFSAVATLTSVVLVPIAGAAITLLYGDAVASRSVDEPEAPETAITSSA